MPAVVPPIGRGARHGSNVTSWLHSTKEHRVKGAPANCAGSNFRSPGLIPGPEFSKVACWLAGCSWFGPSSARPSSFRLSGAKCRGEGGLTNASAVAVSGLQEQHPRTTGQGPRAGLLKTTAVINKTVEPSVKLRFGQARRSADSFCSWFTNLKLQRRAPLASLGDPRRPHGARNTPPHRGGQSKQGA